MKTLGILIVAILFTFTSLNQAFACTVGQVSWINGCEARCIAGWSGGEQKHCSASCLATTPKGYTRIDHSAQVVSQNNGGHTISLLAAGQEHNYTSQVNMSYQAALDLAIKYQDTAAEAKIRQQMQHALSEAVQAKSSHQSVQVLVKASRRGSIVNRIRGWSHVKTRLKVKCLAPPNLTQQIIAKANITDRRATQPKKDCTQKIKWYDGTMRSANYDGANCLVYELPNNVDPFVWSNNYYVKPDSPGVCKIGGWDGANCYLGSAPPNTKAFLYYGRFYY